MTADELIRQISALGDLAEARRRDHAERVGEHNAATFADLYLDSDERSQMHALQLALATCETTDQIRERVRKKRQIRRSAIDKPLDLPLG